MVGKILRENRQIVAGAIIDLGSIIGGIGGGIASGLLISSGVERGLGEEHITVSVHGFDSDVGSDRRMLAHNYGAGPGTLMADVTIIARDGSGKELRRAIMPLNTGYDGDARSFTLPSGEGRRYFLTAIPEFPKETENCELEFELMTRDGTSRTGKSQEFKCRSKD